MGEKDEREKEVDSEREKLIQKIQCMFAHCALIFAF
jgi:hypothetical protein